MTMPEHETQSTKVDAPIDSALSVQVTDLTQSPVKVEGATGPMLGGLPDIPAEYAIPDAQSLPGRWHPQEGAMLAPVLDPHQVGQVFAQAGVIVEMDWYQATPNLLGLSVLVDDCDQLAGANDDGSELVATVAVETLVADLAKRFEAEVWIGEFSAVKIRPDAVFPPILQEPTTTRVVEITQMAAASVPFCAAAEGVDLACVELEGGRRAVLYTQDDDQIAEGAIICELPALALYAEGADLRLVAVDRPEEAQHSYSRIMHSWLMETKLIGVPEQLLPQVRTLLGEEDAAQRISALTQADSEAISQALATPGDSGMRAMVTALHLPESVTAFLRGETEIDQVEGAVVHQARGWANAIGRSVDIMLTEPQSAGNSLWTAYHKVAVEKPWIVRAAASVEAAMGGTLIALSLRGRMRSGWLKLGAVAGFALIADSIAEVSLAKYLGRREQRHRERMSGN